ncbi:MurR/RpiR family transcriptional regulator [Litoreibacter albidus]|uniref:MurR/RpiR family transcriptional regulator n=1 Tax=Litoreibacter albidus TaxID=670155 RepID=UPI00373521DE
MNNPNLASDISQIITQNFEKLTDADTRILKVLTSDPIRGAFENSTEVSSRAGVHPASAVRLARRLGFSGYPEFRSFLQNSLMEGQGEYADPTARIAARIARAGEGGLLSSLIDSEVAALEHLRESVRDAQVREFAEVLLGARRIYTAGTSHGTALAKLMAMRLRRSGYDAVDLGGVGQHQIEWVYTMTDRDVLFLSCFRGTTQQLKHLTDIATERGATCLLLCDVDEDYLKGEKTKQICVSRGGAGESQSLVVPMTIANTIILDLASIDAGKTMRSLNAFKRVRESYRCASS